MVIFDFQGTLSLGASQFGARPVLQRVLDSTGLTALGLTQERYWKSVVQPTWATCSTRAAPFQESMVTPIYSMLIC